MNLQTLMIRAAVAAATGLILSAAVLTDRAGHAANAPVASVTHSSKTAMPEPVTLPTIHVRPAPEDLATAAAPRNSRVGVSIEASIPDLSGGVSAPSLRSLGVDMPYYSFGKVLPRISSKE